MIEMLIPTSLGPEKRASDWLLRVEWKRM